MEWKTTFWNDFTIADKFGVNAIQDTFDRAFKEWKTNRAYLTELVMVLNHKIWQHYEQHNDEYSHLYNKLWQQADEYAINNLKGDDLTYFYNMTD